MHWEYAVVEVVWYRLDEHPGEPTPSRAFVRAVDEEVLPEVGRRGWSSIDMLKRMGAEGWELVAIERPADGALVASPESSHWNAAQTPSFYHFKRLHDPNLPGARDVWKAATEPTKDG